MPKNCVSQSGMHIQSGTKRVRNIDIRSWCVTDVVKTVSLYPFKG